MLANGNTDSTANNGTNYTAPSDSTPYTTDEPMPGYDYDLGIYSQHQEEFLPRLLRAWINERNAPELLPFQFDLVQDTIELVDNQVRNPYGVEYRLIYFA